MIGERTPPDFSNIYKYYVWKAIWSHVKFAVTQKVVKEAELNKYLAREWTFVTELKSGDVIVEKGISAEKIWEEGLQQLKNQAQKE